MDVDLNDYTRKVIHAEKEQIKKQNEQYAIQAKAR